MLNPTVFIDTTAIAIRAVEIPAANFANGCNNSASTSMGIGINIAGGEVVGTPNQFTLEDQRGLTRIAQISQSIGLNSNEFIITGTMPTKAQKDADSSLDGTLIFDGAAALVTLNEGWVSLLEGLWVDPEDWIDAEEWFDN